GYAFGSIMTRDANARRRFCITAGMSMIAAFLIFGGVTALRAPTSTDAPPALFRMLSQSKYPPSALFLCMTLGPVIALMPVIERARGMVANVFATFGRVPLFYYLLHIPLIHASALVVRLIRDGAIHPEHFATAPFVNVPPEYRWSLGLLYLVFVVDVCILYWPCRWFAVYRSEHRQSWVRFI
ncbi:MAG: hypothetical protein JWM95_1876, partial [Gemmatimonadetes bacterium]|nr:hypothetical protein [Gemmatimonadota bacterium]